MTPNSKTKLIFRLIVHATTGAHVTTGASVVAGFACAALTRKLKFQEGSSLVRATERQRVTESEIISATGQSE